MPPAKRPANVLTGGSGDVKPQWSVAQNVANAGAGLYTHSEISTPIPRAGMRNDKATIMEILQVQFFSDSHYDRADISFTRIMNLATKQLHSTGDTCDTASVNDDLNESTIIAQILEAQGTTTSGVSMWHLPTTIDLRDGFGNGMLVATDKLHFSSGNIGATTAQKTSIRYQYRLVDVSIVEYVGIVQSQQ